MRYLDWLRVVNDSQTHFEQISPDGERGAADRPVGVRHPLLHLPSDTAQEHGIVL